MERHYGNEKRFYGKFKMRTNFPVKIIAGFVSLIFIFGCASKGSEIPPLNKLNSPLVDVGINWEKSVGGPGAYQFVPARYDDLLCGAGLEGKISCFNSETGKLVIKINAGRQLAGGVGLSDQILIAGTVRGEALAVNTKSGEILWQTMINSQILGPAKVTGEMIVVRGGSGDILALDRGDGKVLWRYEVSQPALILRSNSTVSVDSEGNIAVGLADGRLVLLDSSAGEVKWDVVVAQKTGTNELERMSDVVGSPLIDNQTVCAIALNGNVACYEKDSGRRIWARKASSSKGLGGGDKEIFYTNESDFIIALEKSTGASIWNQETLYKRNLTAPYLYKDWILVGDSEGFIHVLSRADGRVIGRRLIDKSGFAGPVIGNGDAVYLQSVGGRLYSLSVIVN